MKRLFFLSILFFMCSSFGADGYNLKGMDPYILERIKKESPQLLQAPYTQKKTNELLKKIHALSGAKKVKIDTSNKRARFEVELLPKITSVNLAGDFSSGESDRILRVSGMKPGITLKKEVIEKAAIDIKQLLARDGFYNAEISMETKKNEQGKIHLEIKINKGEALRLESIQIESKNSELNKKLKNELEDFENQILSSGELDLIRAYTQRYLQEQRYLQAKVLEPSYEMLSSGKASLKLKIEKPVLYELSFYGNSDISKSKILRELDLDNPSKNFGLDLSAELRTRIAAIYRKEAYPKSEIDIKELAGENKVTLRIEIKEGPQVKIFSWHVRGSYSKEEQYYIDLIQRLGSSSIANEKLVEEDLKTVLKNMNVFLQNQGYLSSVTELERIKWINDSTVEVYLFIEEGVLTKLNKVIFKNANSFNKDSLLEITELEEGGPLNLNNIESSLSKLKAHYLNHAYLDMKVENQNTNLIQYFDENRKANLIFNINEGDKIEVKNVIVSGTRLTKDSVVLKSLAFESGEYLTLERIKNSESQLQKLGIFSKVDIRPLPANDGKRPVLVKVNERNPGVFTFGPGISDELGGTVRGFTGVVYKNLGGSAKVIQARLEIQKKLSEDSFLENKISLSYLEPFLFGERLKGRTNFSFSQNIDFLASETTTNTYIKETKEINFSMEKDINRYLKLGWNLWGISGTRRFELDRLDDQEKLQVASFGPFLEMDYRDHPFTPKSGTYTRFNLDYATPGLGSSEDIHYLRATGAFNHYIPLTEDRYFVLAYSLRGGYVENVGKPGTYSIPQDEMFFLGGRATLRGFELSEIPNTSEISSLKPTNSSTYYVTDKTYFGLVKIELRFPIYKDFGAALFYDGGLVEIPEIAIEDPYRHSAGIGLRLYTPVGPVSLEYGLKLDKKTGEDDGRIHFSIGAF